MELAQSLRFTLVQLRGACLAFRCCLATVFPMQFYSLWHLTGRLHAALGNRGSCADFACDCASVCWTFIAFLYGGTHRHSVCAELISQYFTHEVCIFGTYCGFMYAQSNPDMLSSKGIRK